MSTNPAADPATPARRGTGSTGPGRSPVRSRAPSRRLSLRRHRRRPGTRRPPRAPPPVGGPRPPDRVPVRLRQRSSGGRPAGQRIRPTRPQPSSRWVAPASNRSWIPGAVVAPLRTVATRPGAKGSGDTARAYAYRSSSGSVRKSVSLARARRARTTSRTRSAGDPLAADSSPAVAAVRAADSRPVDSAPVTRESRGRALSKGSRTSSTASNQVVALPAAGSSVLMPHDGVRHSR